MKDHGVMPGSINEETAASLPEPGDGRWWKVERTTKYRTTPIVVTLMESMSGRRRGLSKALAFELTIADPRRIADAAGLVLARVGDYEKVIGEYGGEA